MAERRMFSIKIIDSDEFLDLPLEAQSLYFHLAMRADDDGFLNSSRRLVRTIGASQDDLKMLVDKRFIILFDSGVVAIRHWKVHNYIAKDRYHTTMFVDEKKQLSCDENGAYMDEKESVYNPYTNCIQPVYKLDTQNRLDKNRLDKIVVYDFTDELSADEIKKLYDTYENAHDLIEQVQSEVNAKHLTIKVSAYAYIVGYAKNKGWLMK